MKYFLLFLTIYAVQAIRVADDFSHSENPEKCKPCYHHRLIKPDVLSLINNTKRFYYVAETDFSYSLM